METDLNQKIKKFLESAYQKLAVNNYNEAIQDLKSAEVLDKQNPEILYNLGVGYSKMGLFKTAIQYFEKLLFAPSKYVEILTVKKLYAYGLINNGEYKMAEESLNEVLSATPGDKMALSMLGFSLEQLDHIDKAIKIYESVIEIDEENYNSYNSIAYLLSKNKRNLKKALLFAEKAVNAVPDNPAYLDTLGYINFQRGDFKKAEICLQKAAAMAPFSKEIQEHLKELEKRIKTK